MKLTDKAKGSCLKYCSKNKTTFKMTQTESIKKQQQLPLANVIHWVAVKDAHPPLDTRKVYLVIDESGNMFQSTWKGTFWESEIYKDEPKVKFWTICEPPCV